MNNFDFEILPRHGQVIFIAHSDTAKQWLLDNYGAIDDYICKSLNDMFHYIYIAGFTHDVNLPALTLN